MRLNRSLPFAAVVLFAFAFPGDARAQQVDGTWNSTGGGTWSTASNWTTDPSAPGQAGATTDIARFLSAITGNSVVTLDTPAYLNKLYFDNSFGYTLAGSGANILNFNGSTPTITVLSGSHTISAQIAGTAGLTVIGPGVLTITGTVANALTGGINIGSGATLRFGGTSASMPQSNVYTLNGGTLGFDFSSVSLSPSRTFNLASGTNFFDTAVATGVVALGGTVSGSGNFVKTGIGTLTLATANPSFTGGIIVAGGTLLITSDANAGAVPGTITPAAITLSGGTFGIATSSSITLNANRGIQLGASGTNALSVTGSGIFTIGGVIANQTTAAGFTKTGAGTLSLIAANTFTGPVVVAAGTLRIGLSSALPTGTSVTINSGAVINVATTLSTGTLALGSVTMPDGIIFSSNLSTASSILNSSSWSLQNGLVAASLGGTNGITKTGLGTVAAVANNFFVNYAQLSNNILGGAFYLPLGAIAGLGATTATNTTTIDGGALVFGASSSGSLSTARVFLLGTSTNNVIDGGSGGATTITGTIGGSGDGGFHKTGTATFAATGTDTYTGPTTIWAGDFRAPLGATGLPNASPLVLSGGVFSSASASFTRTLGTGTGNVAWAPNADGGFAAYGTAVNANLNGTASTLIWDSTGNFLGNGRVLILGSSNANNALTLANPIDLNGSTRTIVVPFGSGGDSATLSGGVSGAAGLVKAGGSPLIFTSAVPPSYTGETTIAAGPLQFASGNLPSGNIALAGGILQLNAASAQTFNLALGSGAGQFRWTGSGGLAAAGAALTVSVNGNSNPLVWRSTVDFVPSGTVDFVPSGSALLFGSSTGTAAITLNNPIDLNSGTRTINVGGGTTTATITNGSLIKSGSGTLALGAGSSLSGTLTITGGTLNAGTIPLTVANLDLAGGLSGTGGVSVTSTMLLRSTSNFTVSNPLSGSASLTNTGFAATTLNGANGYTGATTINGSGRLLLTNPGSNAGSIFGTTSITINGSIPTAVGANGAIYPTLGGMLNLTLTNGQDRLNTPGGTSNGTLPLTINGGSLSIGGDASTAVITQNFAGLTLGSGAAGIFLATNPGKSGQKFVVNFNPSSGNGLTTSVGSTLLVAGPTLGTASSTAKVTFTGLSTTSVATGGTGSMSGSGTAGTTTVGVLRGVFGDTAAVVTTGTGTTYTTPAAGTGMTTYDANGVRLLAGSEYSANATTPAAGVNLQINATTTLSSSATNATINSLTVLGNSVGNTPVVFSQASTATTLTITSGNVLIAGGNNVTTAASITPPMPAYTASPPSIGTGSVAFTLAFGSTTANFVVGNPTITTSTNQVLANPAQLRAVLAAAVTGTGGFTKGGPGILSWQPNAASTGTVSGGIYLNAGILSIASIDATIGTSQNLYFNGGTLQYTGTSVAPASIVSTRSGSVILGGAGGTFDNPTGGGSLGGNTSSASLQIPNAAVNFTGVVSGMGSLTKTGSGGLVLQNNNTYTGGTVLNGGWLVVPTVDAAGTSLLTNQLGDYTVAGNSLTLTTGTLMPAGFNPAVVAGGDSLVIPLSVNLGGESTFGYLAPTSISTGFTPFSAANAVAASLTLSGPMTITNGYSHAFTNNNPANVGGFSLILSGAIGESFSGSNLLFSGVGTSMPANASPLYTPLIAVPTSLTNISITGLNSYTGQTTIRQGIVNPNASLLVGQNGPFGNSYLPIIVGDPGGGAFAGILMNGSNLAIARNIQLQMAGTGGAAASTVAPIYLGTLPGSTGGAISGNIQLANRTLALFSGGGTLAAPMVVSGIISDGGSISHGNIGVNTNGVTSLTGANTYTGGTAITAGTLLVNNLNGSGTGTGAVTVGVGGTLGGHGTIAGSTMVYGTLMPGTCATTPNLNTGDVTFAPGSTLRITLFGTDPTVIGTLNATSITGTPRIVLDLSAVDAASLRTACGTTRTYDFAEGTGAVGFAPTNLSFVSLGNFQACEWSLSSANTTGYVQLNFTPVPEPGTVLLCGVLGLSAVRLGRRPRGTRHKM